MAKANFMLEHKAVLDDMLLAMPGVNSGVVFGLPCYRVRAGVFATLYGDGVGLKLPVARVNELLEKGGRFVPFAPFGRKRGKEFVQVNRTESEAYRQDLALFEESMRYVLASASDKQENAKGVSNMDNGEQQFRAIAASLNQQDADVKVGKMMSSPGIQYMGKVFAFYYAGKMVFRLGRDFQPESFGISQYNLLAPFKTKPPMVDWFEIPASEAQHWEVLTRYALQRIAGN